MNIHNKIFRQEGDEGVKRTGTVLASTARQTTVGDTGGAEGVYSNRGPAPPASTNTNK